MAFIPEAWSARLLDVMTKKSPLWMLYGHSTEWWVAAIERFASMTGRDCSDISFIVEGKVRTPRLTHALMNGKTSHEFFLEVQTFWEERPGLADLMLPKDNEHERQ
jgi:hypothetical protein